MARLRMPLLATIHETPHCKNVDPDVKAEAIPGEGFSDYCSGSLVDCFEEIIIGNG